MRIHLPPVCLLPGCTSRCTLNVSKKFSGQLHFLMYHMCFLHNTGYWIHCSSHTNMCARQVMVQAVPQCLPRPGQGSVGAVLPNWLLENLCRRSVIRWWCYFGVISCLAPPYLCFSWLQGTVLLSACSFEKECRTEPSPLFSFCLLSPGEKTYVCLAAQCCPIYIASFTTHLYLVVNALLHVNPTLFASQPSPKKLHCRPQESSSAQPPDSRTGIHLNCM